MSHENEKIARAALRAMHGRDRHAAAALFTPGVEWHNTASFPGPRVHVGPDAIIDFYMTLTEDFEDFGEQLEHVTSAGDRVVLAFHQWGRGRTGGVPFDLRYAAVIELAGGRVSRVEIHGEYEKALRAAGLGGA